ncbi:hypothetical protein MOX02_18980 [Methylobacterium oxalidis]|uniref:Uncharacterized protein n=2 Tax=Methylobacterium oxalidis TaxID=944322 RepID=A0A512J1L1_9HYPH|nr:hypothetical protein MOX02_18980 [Methylobacterium oxalidis]GLS65282.1 hypothetical protein GCM10007888_36640 [Methylobacterium oxalidis]
MLDPKGWAPRRRLVALSIGTTLARAEQAAKRQSGSQNSTERPYPRLTRLSPAFFDELYDPIGGLRTILRTLAWDLVYQEFGIQRDKLYDTTMIAAIDHCHYRLTASNSILDRLSVKRSCEVYVLVEMAISGCQGPNVANLKDHYLGRFEKSIPFLYAASTIKLTEKQTLLNAIAGANSAAILRPGILRELFGRTLFYTQNVYAKNDKTKNRVAFAREISTALRGVEPRTFDPPDRVCACTKIIEHGYTRAGYDACHDDAGKLRWNSPAFWSALDLPVPAYKRRSRKGSNREQKSLPSE